VDKAHAAQWPGFTQGLLSATLHSKITRTTLPDGSRQLAYDLYDQINEEGVSWEHSIVTLVFNAAGKLRSIDSTTFFSSSASAHLPASAWTTGDGSSNISCKLP
jgi:YD repeat-containing protein